MSPVDFHFLRPLWLVLLIPLALVLWRLLRSSSLLCRLQLLQGLGSSCSLRVARQERGHGHGSGR